MSSILEALKKSEAERTATHTGAAATTQATYRPRQRNNRLIVMTLIAAAIAVAAIAAGGFALRDSDHPPLVENAVQPSPEIESTQDPVSPKDRAELQGAPTGLPTTSSALPPSTAPSEPQTTGNLPDDPASLLVPDPTQPAHPVASQNTAEPAYETVTVDPPVKPVTVTTTTGRAKDVSNTVNSAGSQPVPPGSRLPTLAQLPRTREQIGPLEMSMLVYSADPAKRFALINGQRMREGEELTAGIKLVEIRRDECVFAANGQQFVLRNQ